MLKLHRRINGNNKVIIELESGEIIQINILNSSRNSVTLGFDNPSKAQIYRDEVYQRIVKERNKEKANG